MPLILLQRPAVESFWQGCTHEPLVMELANVTMLEQAHGGMDHKVGLHWTMGGTMVFVCAVLLSVISTVAVALRFFARGYILRVLGPSDWFLFFNLIVSFGNTAWMGFHVAASLDQFHNKLDSEGKKCYLVVSPT